MNKRTGKFTLVLLGLGIFASGCSTPAKSAAGAKNTDDNAPAVAAKDTRGRTSLVQSWDEWIKKNLW
jgi:hypothetical protein